MNSGFFAIGLAEWRRACEIGLNPAVAFLVLACGTGRDNQTSKWSAKAIQTYSGIRWERGIEAIDKLIDAGLVTIADGSTQKFPRYKLKISEDRIWLPRSVIESLDEETPVINRLREAQDVMLLRLFVELYHSQNMANDGGISRSILCRKYDKDIAREFGKMVYLGFQEDARLFIVEESSVIAPHLGPAGPDRYKHFLKRFRTLTELGLLQDATYLLESEEADAEILFPVYGPESQEKLYSIANDVVEDTVEGGSALLDNYKYVIPVYRHLEKAVLYDIFRMRHRAHTSNTKAWYMTLTERTEKARNMFRMATL